MISLIDKSQTVRSADKERTRTPKETSKPQPPPTPSPRLLAAWTGHNTTRARTEEQLFLRSDSKGSALLNRAAKAAAGEDRRVDKKGAVFLPAGCLLFSPQDIYTSTSIGFVE